MLGPPTVIMKRRSRVVGAATFTSISILAVTSSTSPSSVGFAVLRAVQGATSRRVGSSAAPRAGTLCSPGGPAARSRLNSSPASI